jgi:ornithine carbamoyltransferase
VRGGGRPIGCAVQDLLRVGDLTCIELGELIDLAAAMKADHAGWGDALAGETLACFFDPPTTGQTVSVGLAAERLGMLPVMLPRAELLVGGREPLDDIARMFSGSAAALFTHTFVHRTLKKIAAAATVPVINGRSDEHCPCQALADLLTLRERFGQLEGLVLTFVGDASHGVVHSLMEAGALAEMEVRIACPPAYAPSRLVQVGAETFAALHGGSVTVMQDPREAVAGADAVYTSAWVPPGLEAERAERRERLRRYHVHPELMTLAKPRAVFMHCLPARRGEEVAAMVIDGARSVVWEQAANRVPTEQAAIHTLVTAALTPPR